MPPPGSHSSRAPAISAHKWKLHRSFQSSFKGVGKAGRPMWVSWGSNSSGVYSREVDEDRAPSCSSGSNYLPNLNDAFVMIINKHLLKVSMCDRP